MELPDDTVYCKSLWTLLSGSIYDISSDAVDDELDKAQPLLKNGLNYYKRAKEPSDDLLKSKLSAPVFKFVTTLGSFLDLDAVKAWNLLSIYLLHEFHGSVTGLQQFVENDDLTENLIYDIWTFYRSERIFLLKCINYILIHHDDDKHPFKNNFSRIITSFEDLYRSLIDQLTVLTNEDGPTTKKYGPLMVERYKRMWVYSNLREQIEVLHNLILVTDVLETRNAEDFAGILRLCSENGFGEQKEAWKLLTDVPDEPCKIIGFLQNVLLLRTFNYESACNKKLYENTNVFCLIEDQVTSLGHAEEQSPVMLVWGLVNALCNPDVHLLESYQLLSELAVRLGVFQYLKKCIESEIFQDVTKLSAVAYRTVYLLLLVIANNFDENTICCMKGLSDLIGSVLDHPTIVDTYWKTRKNHGLRLLCELLALKFPIGQFLPFARVVQALSSDSADSARKIHSELVRMERFGDIVSEEDMNRNICQESSDTWRLQGTRKPMKFSNFLLQNTRGTFIAPPLISWHVENFSFYEAVYNEQKALVEEKLSSDDGDLSSAEENVLTGLHIINNMLLAKVDLCPELTNAVNYTVTMITRFKRIKRASAKVFSSCLDIMTTLASQDRMKVYTVLKQLQIFPTLENAPLNLTLISGNYLYVRTIGDWLYNEECPSGTYALLKSYLNFLYKIIKPNTTVTSEEKTYAYSELVLPGLIFILNEVFPRYQTWNYVSDCDQLSIGVTCMKVFHELLLVGEVTNGPETTYLHLFRKLILHSVLHTPSGFALLKIVATGDPAIQGKVEHQYHWDIHKPTNAIYIVQLSLSLLNRVMLLKHLVQDEPLTSQLEMEIYNSPLKETSLKVIQNLTGYIYHCFNPSIPILAVKLLKRFAMESPRNLFPCMAKEGDIVREMFVRHLESHIVSDSLKEALLELVIACCDTQPGITESLFHVYASPDITTFGKKAKNDTKPSGGILVFVCSVLSRLKEEPLLINSGLYNVVVDLICTIWLGEMVSVIDHLRSKENFWANFCCPLFCDPGEYSKAYPKIFNVLTVELYRFKGQNCSEVTKSLKSFFKEDASYLENWSLCISSLLVESLEPKWNIGLNKAIFGIAAEKHHNVGNIEECEEHGLRSASDAQPGSSAVNKTVSPGKRKPEDTTSTSGITPGAERSGKRAMTDNADNSQSSKSKLVPQTRRKAIENNIYKKKQTGVSLDMDEKIKLLTSWKQFLAMVLKHAEISMSAYQKELLSHDLMSVLQLEVGNDDARLFTILAEAYLLVVNEWHCTCHCNKELTKVQLMNLLQYLVVSYSVMTQNVRELILTLCIQLYGRCSKQLQEDDFASESTLYAISSIVTFEMTSLEKPVIKEAMTEEGKHGSKEIENWLNTSEVASSKETEKAGSCILSLCLLRKFLMQFQGRQIWLNNYRCSSLIPTLLQTYGRILSHIREIGMVARHFNIAVSLIDVLLLLLNKNFSGALLHMDMKSAMWLELLPPRKLDSDFWAETPWTLVYGPSLDVLTWMLTSQGHHFLEDAISFAAIHEEYLTSAILTVRHTLKQDVLRLAIKVLNFIRVLSNYHENWMFSHSHSHKYIIDGVKACFYYTGALLIHPSLLKMLVKQPRSKPVTKITSLTGDETESAPEIVEVQNRLLEVAVMCLVILRPFGPGLLPLLNGKMEEYVDWQPIVDTIFSTPMLDEDSPIPNLTFGALITMINICTQALSKGSRTGQSTPSTSVRYSTVSSGLSTVWVSTLNKQKCTVLLELCLELVITQGLLHSAELPQIKREMFHRNLSMEMTLFLDYTKRFARETSVSKSDTTGNVESVPRSLARGFDVDQIAAAMVPLKRSLSDPNRTLRRSLNAESPKTKEEESVQKNLPHNFPGRNIGSPLKSPGSPSPFRRVLTDTPYFRQDRDHAQLPSDGDRTFLQCNEQQSTNVPVMSTPGKSLSTELQKMFEKLIKPQTAKVIKESQLPTLYEDISPTRARTQLINFKECSSENYCQLMAYIINSIFS
ncbi:nucleoporin Nup188 [Schistocerca americana]|uniref:nucleoporin Nup188 n=1 Tax=Schistocerca americana TaxID=7009 RepID=UPI001F4FFC5A|nr:nucleoporin Nup188 [Schistocerca americana]